MLKQRTPKPKWLIRKLPKGPEFEHIRSLIDTGNLHTVCREANCPNRYECYSNHTAAFMILGSICTRNCRFCNVKHGVPGGIDLDEPGRVAAAAEHMNLKYAVVTSVTRDDLPDGGAGIFADVIRRIRGRVPDGRVEVLIPDFQGDESALKTVLDARPDVINHNIETVARLYPEVRPRAGYERSLDLLRRSNRIAPDIPVKSGMMLGLGETDDEIKQTLSDLYDAGCSGLTLGQYLQPSSNHLPVQRFIPPEIFDRWRETALDIGFRGVAAGPFVRSSYHAKALFSEN